MKYTDSIVDFFFCTLCVKDATLHLNVNIAWLTIKSSANASYELHPYKRFIYIVPNRIDLSNPRNIFGLLPGGKVKAKA